MKAAWYLDIGPAEVLQVGEMPKPDPKAGQVQVRIHAHGVNPTDWKRRAGQRGGAPTERMIPGYDGAGVIAALGDGVSTARLGERVWVWEGFHQQPHGTAAEFVCVDQSRAIALPTSLSFEEGACLGVPALTACHSLMLAGPLDGEAVIALQESQRSMARLPALVQRAIQSLKLIGPLLCTVIFICAVLAFFRYRSPENSKLRPLCSAAFKPANSGIALTVVGRLRGLLMPTGGKSQVVLEAK
ncbi:MAG: hypothetical protein EBV68_02045 [Betaproteobacteria bacterium]|nr:hypothetical protein [Betaproteobacteria bacterium]